MRLARMAVLLLAWNGAAANLTTSRVASVNACLGAVLEELSPSRGAAPCGNSVDRQVDDGSMLSVKTTLVSRNGQGQFNIDGSAQAGYGILHAGMSSALDTTLSVTKASSHTQAGFEDIVTIGSPVLNGQPGLLNLSYTLSGSGSSSGQSTSFATVRILAGVSLEQQQTQLHASSEWGRFSLSQTIRFTYGVPFGLELILESTNRLGASVAAPGTANLVEVLVLSGLIPADQQGNPVNGAQFTSASQTQYGVNGVASSTPPLPGSSPPFISSLQPALGPAATMVTVSGTGFLPTFGSGSAGDFGGNTVTLGSQVVINNLNSPDGLTLEFQVPPNIAPGTYSLDVSNQNGTSNTVSFTVTKSSPLPGSSSPFISSLQPASGPAGTMVTVSGTGFLPTFGSGSGGYFGGNTVTLGSQVVVNNLNSQDGLTLQFQVPPNIAPGTYSLGVSNQNGASNTVSFTVTKS
jgi:hypothetical protein